LLARFDALPWDKPIFNWVIDSRSTTLARRVSFFGSTPVVFVVSGLAALVAWQRCPRLAIAIVVVAFASEGSHPRARGRSRRDPRP
jgi:hypothetical protein